MPTTLSPEWQQMALYALAAALALILVSRIPVIGRLVRFALSLGILAFCIFVLMQQAPYQPQMAGVLGSLGLDRQQVVGREVRIRMAADGHFWARARLNGVERRMLIDSGATVTTLSEATAAAAGVEAKAGVAPILLRTANGVVPARTGAVEELELGTVTARDLKVVVTPSIGNLDVIGMNFLSQLASWRVEGRTLVLEPKRAEG
jgi:aspartyl protease family protein